METYSYAPFIIGALLLAAFFAILTYQSRRYKKTDYYRITHTPYKALQADPGKRGEFAIYERLRALKGYKHFLFNCYVPKGNGETTEIDVILLHTSGIYVFESKNYHGWIFGSDLQEHWTQLFPNQRGPSQRIHFFNPIIQNQLHIRWLRRYLREFRAIPIFSYVVFGDQCTLKYSPLTTEQHQVLHLSELLHAVQSQVRQSKTVWNPNSLEVIYEKLYPLTQVEPSAHEKHVEQIRHKRENRPGDPPPPLPCPLCDGHLVKRVARRGIHAGKSFYGCSNYPYCRYIKNEENE